MINARVYGYLDDQGTQKIGGTITAIGGRYDDIKAVRWDDGITTDVAEHNRGIAWDYDDEDEDPLPHGRNGEGPTMARDTVSQYVIETQELYRTMTEREALAHVAAAISLGDIVQDYETTDRAGRPLRVVLYICQDPELQPHEGCVYVFTR